MLKDKSKPAAATTEVIVGTALAVVALVVTIGLFNDNLSEMVANSNLSNIFTGNDSKTEYSAFNRDYSNSQINVQIMGEQGLGMLRRIANNKAIEQIGGALSGADTSATNVNSIAYLTMAIKAIVGKPGICVYMKKDSDKFCDEDDIGGYDYNVNLNSSALTIKKADSPETKTLTIGSNLNNALSSTSIPINTTGRSEFNMKEKYNFIRELSEKAASAVYSHVILIRTVQTFVSENSKKTISASPTDLLSSLNTILNNMKSKSDNAYTRCYCYHTFWGIECVSWKRFLTKSGCGGSTINKNDNSKIKNWTSEVSASLSSSVSQGGKSSDIIKLFTSSLDANDIINILNDDNTNNPNACKTLISDLRGLSDKYGIPKSDLGLTETSSGYTLTRNGQVCSSPK